MTNGHPGAGGPYEDERDDRFTARRRAGRNIWEPTAGSAGASQPITPAPAPQPWSHGAMPRPFDRPGNGATSQPPTGSPNGGRPGGPYAGPADGSYGRPASHQANNPGGQPYGMAYSQHAGQPAYPAREPYPEQGHQARFGYPAQAGVAGRQRGWQDPLADPWSSPGVNQAQGWRGGLAGVPQQVPDGSMPASEPGQFRASAQRSAGGARVRKVWPQRLALVGLVVVAMIACWYWVFPWLETILPSQF